MFPIAPRNYKTYTFPGCNSQGGQSNSGEFVDAFVFGTFALGTTQLSVKLGQHNVYWGETMFSIADGVSAGQGPLDTIKAATTASYRMAVGLSNSSRRLNLRRKG